MFGFCSGCASDRRPREVHGGVEGEREGQGLHSGLGQGDLGQVPPRRRQRHQALDPDHPVQVGRGR